MARLAAAVVCLGVALCAVIPAAYIPLWILSVGATEYGHWFVLAPALVAIAGSPRSLTGFLALLLLCGAACALFLSSLFQAIPVAQGLPDRLAAAFGHLPPGGEPLSLATLWFGKPAAPVPRETYSFAEHETGKLDLFFYRALSSTPAPCVLVLHTGGWNSGSADEFVEFNCRLARLGYGVAAMDTGSRRGGNGPRNAKTCWTRSGS